MERRCFEGFGIEDSAVKVKALDAVRGEPATVIAGQGLEDDGDGAQVEVIGELAGEGEGFGAEEMFTVHPITRKRRSRARWGPQAVKKVRTVGEEGAKCGIFGTGGSAEGDVGIVEEDGRMRGSADAGDEGGSGEGRGEGGILTKQKPAAVKEVEVKNPVLEFLM